MDDIYYVDDEAHTYNYRSRYQPSHVEYTTQVPHLITGPCPSRPFPLLPSFEHIRTRSGKRPFPEEESQSIGGSEVREGKRRCVEEQEPYSEEELHRMAEEAAEKILAKIAEQSAKMTPEKSQEKVQRILEFLRSRDSDGGDTEGRDNPDDESGEDMDGEEYFSNDDDGDDGDGGDEYDGEEDEDEGEGEECYGGGDEEYDEDCIEDGGEGEGEDDGEDDGEEEIGDWHMEGSGGLRENESGESDPGGYGTSYDNEDDENEDNGNEDEFYEDEYREDPGYFINTGLGEEEIGRFDELSEEYTNEDYEEGAEYSSTSTGVNSPNSEIEEPILKRHATVNKGKNTGHTSKKSKGRKKSWRESGEKNTKDRGKNRGDYGPSVPGIMSILVEGSGFYKLCPFVNNRGRTCGHIMTNLESLNHVLDHMAYLKVEGEDGVRFKCPEPDCSKPQQYGLFSRHFQTHCMAYTCPLNSCGGLGANCGKQFTRKDAFRRHVEKTILLPYERDFKKW